MPSKKKKYNARFPAGRIKKIMRADDEVGKVAQAVPVIISRTLELFVKSLLVQATQVTASRNAKTLSPSHLKQCILHETRFDFLRELVKNIPDVTAAEEKEMQSAEHSPNSTGEAATTQRRPREEAASAPPPESLKRPCAEPAAAAAAAKLPRAETVTSAAIDLSRKPERPRAAGRPNFYKETLPDQEPESVIRANPYAQPSTSALAEPAAPVINIDFTKNLSSPEIRVLDAGGGPRALRADGSAIPHNFTVKALSSSASRERGGDARRHWELDEDYDT